MKLCRSSKHLIKKRIEELDRRKNLLRIDRKIDFLLDIRGYFIVNKITGNYVEFGCYQGEMLFAALQVLGPKKLCDSFIGIDTFEGEPVFTKNDTLHNSYNLKGDYRSIFEAANELFQHEPRNVMLIKGDFRKKAVLSKLAKSLGGGDINISVVDCNISSSIKSALEFSFHRIKDGGFLFIDDFYTNVATGEMHVKSMLYKVAAKSGKELHHYKSYPPFAEAFIVTSK